MVSTYCVAISDDHTRLVGQPQLPGSPNTVYHSTSSFALAEVIAHPAVSERVFTTPLAQSLTSYATSLALTRFLAYSGATMERALLSRTQ